MRNALSLILLTLFFGHLINAQEINSEIQKQVQFCSNSRESVSARFSSLGGAFPAITKDIGGLNANPNAIANISALQSSFTSALLFCDRRSLNFHVAKPFEPKRFISNLSLGFFYQEDVFSDKTLVKDLRNQSVLGIGSSFGI